jgi:hypothetical protein
VITFMMAVSVMMLTGFYAASRISNHAQETQSKRRIPIVTVQTQLDSPLRISTTEVTSTDPLTPGFNFTITNTSNRLIRAYAIRHDTSSDLGENSGSGLMFFHLSSIESLLKPSQAIQETHPASATYSQPVKTIILSIDFVEFDDGSTWGADTFKSADRLAGQRAGGHAAINKLRSILRAGGPAAVVRAMTTEEANASPQSGGSKEWQDGFQAGFGIVRNRLQRAQNKGGLAAVAAELDQPFDASEGRQLP